MRLRCRLDSTLPRVGQRFAWWRLLPGRSCLARRGERGAGGLHLPRRLATTMAANGVDSPQPQLLSVAPMMDWTDLHYRQLARLISRHTWLYTEMVVDLTIIHTQNRDRFLWFPPEQRPIVLQLGGSDPDKLEQAASLAAPYGYDEINLNCGCPSDRVAGAGCFGAALMLRPEVVAEACSAIARGAAGTPVTVKCRLGVDDVDSYADVVNFVRVVSANSPVTHFIIHSRKCFLKGLNPHENRTVPPLRREWVWALKRDFPHLHFSLNGGIQTAHEAAAALSTQAAGAGGGRIHGVMIGRAAYNAPWATLSDADRAVFGAAQNAATSRRQVLQEYAAYGDAILGRFGSSGDAVYPSVRAVCKPLLGMFHGDRGGKKWRNAMDVALARKPPPATVSEVIQEALAVIPDEVLDAPPAPWAGAAHGLGGADAAGGASASERAPGAGCALPPFPLPEPLPAPGAEERAGPSRPAKVRARKSGGGGGGSGGGGGADGGDGSGDGARADSARPAERGGGGGAGDAPPEPVAVAVQ